MEGWYRLGVGLGLGLGLGLRLGLRLRHVCRSGSRTRPSSTLAPRGDGKVVAGLSKRMWNQSQRSIVFAVVVLAVVFAAVVVVCRVGPCAACLSACLPGRLSACLSAARVDRQPRTRRQAEPPGSQSSLDLASREATEAQAGIRSMRGVGEPRVTEFSGSSTTPEVTSEVCGVMKETIVKKIQIPGWPPWLFAVVARCRDRREE